MKEENEEEKQKTEEEQKESAETAEEIETEEKAEEILEKEEEIVEEAVEAEEEKPTPIEEEIKPPPREERLEKEERIYTIPLSKAWIAPPNKRAPRAIRIIKAFLTRHMKLEARREGEMEEEEPKKLIVSNEVNERVWRRGIQKPPRKIRVRAAKDKEGNVTVYLAEGD